jgi:DNA processing protein
LSQSANGDEVQGELLDEGVHSEDELLPALGFDPVSLDALVARTGIAASVLQARLLELELQGDVARLPGGLFQRISAG